MTSPQPSNTRMVCDLALLGLLQLSIKLMSPHMLRRIVRQIAREVNL